jgi:hypothetical protein
MWWTKGAGVMGLFGASRQRGRQVHTRAKITFTHQHHTRRLHESRCDHLNCKEKPFVLTIKFAMLLAALAILTLGNFEALRGHHSPRRSQSSD